MFGLIEAGGTKFIVGAGRTVSDAQAFARIPTTQPAETMAAVLAALHQLQAEHGRFTAIGVASFGPLELDRRAADWGCITRTTKPGWSHTDIAGPLSHAFGCPIGLDTDVNAAALAEYRWGAAQGRKVALYLTIGTGIGGGAIIDGRVLHGVSHPEMGHFRVPRHPDERDFAGVCPFHGDCLEGLASGPAIIARWGASLSDLGADHPGHAIIAAYLAEAVCTWQAIFEPGCIIFGGGVMGTPGLLDRVRAAATARGKGYFRTSAAEIVMPPGLGDRAGLLGALALAQDAG